MKRNKSKGITLIALVITIIIMLILVAVTVNYGIKSGLLSKSKDATADYKFKEEEDKIGAIRLAYKVDSETEKNIGTLKEYLEKELTGEAVVDYTTEGISVLYNDSKKTHIIKEELNKYGFYYNKSYKIDKDWWADGEHGEDDNAIIKFLENGNMYIKSYEKELYKFAIENGYWSSGPCDFFGESIRQSAEGDYAFDNVKPNVTYNAKASLNSDFNFVINENGDLITTYIISKENIKLSEKQIILGDEANEHFTFEVLADGNKLRIKEINKVFTIVD